MIDLELARHALQRVLPMLEVAVHDRTVCGAGFMHVVVMDPGKPPGSCDFEEAILLEHELGDTARRDADYTGFARAKARLSWHTGLDGTTVQTHHPHRLRPGDTMLTGGICLDGIVVGVSGAFPWFDEAFGVAIAAQIRAACKDRHAGWLQDGLLEIPRHAGAEHDTPARPVELIG